MDISDDAGTGRAADMVAALLNSIAPAAGAVSHQDLIRPLIIFPVLRGICPVPSASDLPRRQPDQDKYYDRRIPATKAEKEPFSRARCHALLRRHYRDT
jgi:hypothetical protein